MEIKRFPLVYERDAMWQLWHGSWMRKDYEGMHPLIVIGGIGRSHNATD